ncbi:hypothetical protein LPJ66_007997 [Kickxella alabastrina]|uniref:Uncharacterized protein n=1 Tax=Kickxella alabastrina TaxID=61397 RepID=A0ACC1I7C1_9FUNG|nr:hypothetical protein LPJ66_007997 [Kickxella alabastrina]
MFSPRTVGFAAKELRQCTLGRTPTQLQSLPPMGYLDLGTVPYLQALHIQTRFNQLRIANLANPSNQTDRQPKLTDTLFLLQHPPVYTNGLRNRGKLPPSEIQRLRSLGSEYAETGRGGEITFHGPGQLVLYPSVFLRNHHLGVKCYVEGLENTVVDACMRLGVKAQPWEGFPGVWVGGRKVAGRKVAARKVAAVGSGVKRYVTLHGLALNCSTDMRWFQHIVPCGLEGKEAVSLEQILARRVEVQEMVPHILSSFSCVFNCDLLPLHELSPATHQTIVGLVDESKKAINM